MKELIEAEHIGDGLYMIDYGYSIGIAVNHHTNIVASIDIFDYDKAIDYIKRCKENKKQKNENKT